MWAKNLLFLSICAVGLALLVGGVAPSFTTAERERAVLGLASIQKSAARIDAAFARQWQEQGIAPAPPADDLQVARRMALALAGTIPSLEDIRHLEGLREDQRLSIWLAELLADRRSADYLAERLARAYVGVEGGPFLLYRRRRFVSWLADELAANRPYDEIVRHLIADTGLWTDSPAVNFVTVTINPGDENRPDPNRLAARVARSMLGVRLDCAECHDHPFAAWKQRDFQALAAFFGGTRQSLRGIRDYPGDFKVENLQTGDSVTMKPSVPFDGELLSAEGTQRQRLAGWVTHPGNRAFARATVNRTWAILFGRPLVEPIDDLPPDGELPRPLEILADDFVAHGFDLRRLVAVIATTDAFQLDSKLPPDANTPSEGEFEKRERAWAVFPLSRLRPEQVVGALLQASSLATIDYESNILIRAARTIGQNEFVERYGDAGADEFEQRSGTTSQRLVLMNGKIVTEKTKNDLLASAASQIAAFAPNDRVAVESSFLAVLSRRPTEEEAALFASRLRDTQGERRTDRLSDLYWTLLNSTEFSWNH
jgi:hypothetical protein